MAAHSALRFRVYSTEFLPSLNVNQGNGDDSSRASSHLGFHRHKKLLGAIPSVRSSSSEQGTVPSTSARPEPKWKQKLAAADSHAEETRRQTEQAQKEYKQRQAQLRAGGGQGSTESLASLELFPYLTEDGKFTDLSNPQAKATVYAIFDEEKKLVYIGISRQVNQSMRLHFARMPRQCSWIKVKHITRPSRSILEGIRDAWIEENGSRPSGNDEGELQNLWENALDCKPLMTEDEKKALEEALPGPPKAKVLKQVARRVEKGLKEGYAAQGCTEGLRFDPKLKDSGLLDLQSIVVPNTSVPKTPPAS